MRMIDPELGPGAPATPLAVKFPALAPEVIGLRDFLDQREAASDALHASTRESSNISRARQRATSGSLNDSIANILVMATSLLGNEPPETDSQQFLAGLLEPLDSLSRIEELKPFMTGLITASLDTSRTFCDKAAEISEQVRDEAVKSESSAYEIIKILAKRPETYSDASEGRESNAVKLAVAYSGYAQTGGDSVAGYLSEKLETEDCDAYIAADILTEAVSDGQSGNGKATEDLRKFIEVVKIVGRVDDDEAIRILCGKETLQNWPSPFRAKIIELKERYKQDLLRNLKEAREHMEEDNLVLPPANHEEFAASLQNYKAALLQHNFAHMTGAQRAAAIASGELPASKKRGNGRIKTASRLGQAATPAKAEVEEVPVNRELVFVDAQGNTQPKDGEAYAKMIKEGFLKQYRGTPDLPEDVDAMLEYLKRVDHSKGPVRGIKKYHSRALIDGKPENINALKPSEAVGLSTSSEVSKRTRVLFAINAERVAILAICNRRDVVRYEKSFGITSAAK
jgi:hypothetical protein